MKNTYRPRDWEGGKQTSRLSDWEDRQDKQTEELRRKDRQTSHTEWEIKREGETDI